MFPGRPLRTPYTTVYGAFTLVNDRIFPVYGHKGPFFGKLRDIDHDFVFVLCRLRRRWSWSTDQSDKMVCDQSVYRPAPSLTPLQSNLSLKINQSKRKKIN